MLSLSLSVRRVPRRRPALATHALPVTLTTARHPTRHRARRMLPHAWSRVRFLAGAAAFIATAFFATAFFAAAFFPTAFFAALFASL